MTEFDELALAKLTRVLGADRARHLLEELLSQRGSRLLSAQDLYEFSQALTKRQGFEGALGAMLGVTAVIRGARPGSPS
jgi:hypothetical protein